MNSHLRNRKISDARKTALELLLAAVFSFFNVYTYMAEKCVSFTKAEYAIVIIDVFLLTGAVFLAVRAAEKLWRGAAAAGAGGKSRDLPGTGRRDERLSDRSWYLLAALALFLMWLPVFLAYYPGLFAYDVDSQLFQDMGSYSTHHPLIHTLYLKFFYNAVGLGLFHSPNAGIACATLVQMALFAAMLAYMHLFLRKTGMPFRARVILIAAEGLLPFFSMLAISTTKDTLFSGFVCLFITALCGEVCFPAIAGGTRNRFVLAGAAAGVILMRNNGIYPLAAACAYLLFVSLKQRKFRLLIFLLAGTAAGLLTSEALKIRLQAENVSVNEALGLLYQQMACAYQDHAKDMTGEEQRAILDFIPEAANYYAHNVDTIKFTAEADKDLGGFISVYLKTGRAWPKSYLKAACLLDAGYLCLADTTYSRIYGTDNRQGLFLSDTKPGFEIDPKPLLPHLEAVCEELYSADKYLYVAGLNILCSPALYFWAVFALLGHAVIRRQRRTAVLYVFVCTLIATILAGPCALIRYALAYIVVLPVLAAAAFRYDRSGFGSSL